jgi:hypothetical protein
MNSHIGRAVLAAALALSIAGCAGGGGPAASVPAVAPGSGSNTASDALIYPLSAGGSTFALPEAGGYGGTVSFPAFAAPAGASIEATASTTAPASLAQAALRSPAETGTAVVYYYLTFTPSMTISLPTVPAYAMGLGNSLAKQNVSFYYALSQPAASGAVASFRTEGPATVSGNTATFTPSDVPLTLHAGTRYVFAFYSLARVSAGAPFVYVANGGANAVAAFSLAASGDVAPDFTIAGPATQLAQPLSLGRDAAGRLYAGNHGGTGTGDILPGTVTVYAKGAKGNAAPVRTIGGPLTGIVNLRSIAVDGNGRVYVADNGAVRGDSSVRVFEPSANGNVAPSQVLTTPYLPLGIGVDAQDEIVVSNIHPAAAYTAIETYAPAASGNAAPLRAITGPATGLGGPGQLAIDDARQQVFVVDGSSVLGFPLKANGNVAPVARLGGANTGLSSPSGVALTSDSVVVSDAVTWNVSVFARGALGNVAPVRTIGGPLTTLDQPRDVLIVP